MPAVHTEAAWIRCRLPLVAALIVGLVVAGCGDGSHDVDVATELQGWWVLRQGMIDGSSVAAVDGYPITLQIAGERVTGDGGCNTYQGTIFVDGSELTLQDLSITERACADTRPMEIEVIYIGGLWRGTTIERTFDGIIITGRDVSLHYGPAPLRSEN